jgi:hypothetical protein
MKTAIEKQSSLEQFPGNVEMRDEKVESGAVGLNIFHSWSLPHGRPVESL